MWIGIFAFALQAADRLGLESLLNLTIEELVREPLPGQEIVDEGRTISSGYLNDIS